MVQSPGGENLPSPGVQRTSPPPPPAGWSGPLPWQVRGWGSWGHLPPDPHTPSLFKTLAELGGRIVIRQKTEINDRKGAKSERFGAVQQHTVLRENNPLLAANAMACWLPRQRTIAPPRHTWMPTIQSWPGVMPATYALLRGRTWSQGQTKGHHGWWWVGWGEGAGRFGLSSPARNTRRAARWPRLTSTHRSVQPSSPRPPTVSHEALGDTLQTRCMCVRELYTSTLMTCGGAAHCLTQRVCTTMVEIGADNRQLWQQHNYWHGFSHFPYFFGAAASTKQSIHLSSASMTGLHRQAVKSIDSGTLHGGNGHASPADLPNAVLAVLQKPLQLRAEGDVVQRHDVVEEWDEPRGVRRRPQHEFRDPAQRRATPFCPPSPQRGAMLHF